MVKISKEETGKRIRRLLAESGITVRDVQEELELDSPQSVYKWLKGKALPSLDNLLVLGLYAGSACGAASGPGGEGG